MIRTNALGLDKHVPPLAWAPLAIVFASCSNIASTRHANGCIAATGQLVAGRQEGEWRHYHENGRLESQGAYRADVRDGYWQFFHADGTPRMAGRFVEERQEGPWRFWHPNGVLAARGSYRSGREHGPWTFWHDDGRVRQRGVFVDGRRELAWETFAAGGGPGQRTRYVGGKPGVGGGPDHVEAWPEGGVRREGRLVDGLPQGPWLVRHRNGEARAFGSMLSGRADGAWWFGNAAGDAFAAVDLRDGVPIGPCTVFDARGDVASTLRTVPPLPWDGDWSADDVVAGRPPLDVVGQWLAEAQAPLEVPREVPTPPVATPVATAAPMAEPSVAVEAPTDPGHFTVREREELATLRRYYRDGFLPRQSDLATAYGSSGSGGLGGGDEARAAALLGRPLPVTRFEDLDGGAFDLASLRGRNVLLVVLRGFTSQVCVYCFAQTAELAPRLPEFAAAGSDVVVLFPGSKGRAEAFRSACAREFGGAKPPYRIVYDPDLALGKALGIEGRIVRPASLLLDGGGAVRFAYVAESVQNIADRPSSERLLRAARELAP